MVQRVAAKVAKLGGKSGPIWQPWLWITPPVLLHPDQIALPDFSAGAMENWGLITYRETALLYNPAFSSNADKEFVATVISHELAHMVHTSVALQLGLPDWAENRAQSGNPAHGTTHQDDQSTNEQWAVV